MSVRKIIHVDMDAFYASVEQRDHPDLKGKPLAVGYPAKRGVVAAASYEARKFGVRSAMPSVTAQRKCPELIFMPPRFEVYRAVSQQIRQIFADYTPLIEPLSLDEAYLDVTENLRGIPTASATAIEIRKRIFEETGLTASAGISYNKFLAKMASDYRKPNGQFVILPDNGPTFIEQLAVGKFYGIGPVTAEKMKRLGIHIGADLRNQSIEFLQENFGKSGAWYYSISRGEDNRTVKPDRIRKSYGSETTFREDLTNAEDIENGIIAMCDDVWGWCSKTGNFGRTMTVKVKFGDFKQITRSQSLLSPIMNEESFYKMAIDLIRSVFPLRMGIRLVGVTLSNFETKAPEEEFQLGLL
jgi:DNA polymerase-4